MSSVAERMATGRNPQWDIDWEIGKNGELFVIDVIQSLKDGARVETKTDIWAARTNNIYIEYSCRYFGKYKPSGISVTTAEVWALVLATEVAVFAPVDRLKAVARYYYVLGRTKHGGLNGTHPTWGVLIPVPNLLRDLMNPPPLPPRPRPFQAALSTRDAKACEVTCTFTLLHARLSVMGRNFAPPLDSEAIRRARLLKFMTQAEVAEQVAAHVAADGIKFDRSGLSYIENGSVKRPSPKVVRALSEVLGIEPDVMYKAAA